MNEKKQKIIEALYKFVNQRSGIDYRDYAGDREALMSDYRPMIREGKEARTMLRFIELSDSISAEDIIESSKRAFSGRLTITEKADKIEIDYCVGQYFPTEYRASVCAVCSQSIWEYFREDCNCKTREDIQKSARRNFSRAITNRWFN